MSKAVVLFSGGQDSTTCLHLAKTIHEKVVAVSVRYGQRHAAELEAAGLIAYMAGVKHVFLDVPALGALGGSALVDASQPLTASGGLVDAEMPQGLPSSFVPARNILLLTLAAAVAVREGAHDVYSGICQTDYSGYPDCRRPFVDALEETLALGLPSSVGPIRIVTPLMHMTKGETVRLAERLGPHAWEALKYTVTCYEGKRPGCDVCPACALRRAGFAEAGLPDPALS